MMHTLPPADHMTHSHLGALNLTGSPLSAQLQRGLRDLSQPCGSVRVATADQSAVGGERNSSAKLGFAVANHAVTLAGAAEAKQFVVHEILDRERAVDSDQAAMRTRAASPCR